MENMRESVFGELMLQQVIASQCSKFLKFLNEEEQIVVDQNDRFFEF